MVAELALELLLGVVPGLVLRDEAALVAAVVAELALERLDARVDALVKQDHCGAGRRGRSRGGNHQVGANIPRLRGQRTSAHRGNTHEASLFVLTRAIAGAVLAKRALVRLLTGVDTNVLPRDNKTARGNKKPRPKPTVLYCNKAG